MVGSSSPENAPCSMLKASAISRPACPLPHFHQLYAEILHGLQGTVKLRLVAKNSYQDRAVRLSVRCAAPEASVQQRVHQSAHRVRGSHTSGAQRHES